MCSYTCVVMLCKGLLFACLFSSYYVLQDIYTLNFLLDCKVCPSDFMRYFLALFPVLTLSSSFPIITVTLRNNLRNASFKKFFIIENYSAGKSVKNIFVNLTRSHLFWARANCILNSGDGGGTNKN